MIGTSRDPLLDPRTGDIVADAHGAVLEVVDVVLGRGAYVHVREDSSRYRVEHDGWRAIVAGGRVIHAALDRETAQVQVRHQSLVTVQEIPLLENAEAMSAIRLLQDQGYTIDDIRTAFEHKPGPG